MSSINNMENGQSGKNVGAGQAPTDPSGGTYGKKRLQMAQAQVNEVIDVMKNNVDKVMERENQLSNLDHRADVLQAGASQFQQSSRSLRQKYWWQNIRMMIILGAIGLLLVLMVILWISN